MSVTLRDRASRGGLLFALGFFFVSASEGLNGQPPAPPDKLTIDYRVGPGSPMPIRGYDHYYAYLIDTLNLKGKRWERQVMVISPQHEDITLPALRKDEIVAMFGSLYRVESAAPLEVVRIKADDAPKGLAVESDSVAIPLMRDEAGMGRIRYRNAKGQPDGKTLFVTSIAPAGDKGGEPVAQVKLDDIRKEAQTLRRGDVLKIGEREWTVRKLVPADTERRILGWVELTTRKNGADR